MSAVFFVMCAIAGIWSATRYKAVYREVAASLPQSQDDLIALYSFSAHVLSPSTPLPLQMDYVKALFGSCVSLLCASLGFFVFPNVLLGCVCLLGFLWATFATVKSWKTYKENCSRTPVGTLLSQREGRARRPSASQRGMSMLRSAAKLILYLAIGGMAVRLCAGVYVAYRYGNIERVAIEKMSDLDKAFEISGSRLKLKNPEFGVICFVDEYRDSLENAANYISPAERSEFALTLRAADTLGDVFNNEGNSSIVLLSRTSAQILQFDSASKLGIENEGCARAGTDDIEIRQSGPDTRFYLPNASMRQSRE